jgi:hypothetical protein
LRQSKLIHGKTKLSVAKSAYLPQGGLVCRKVGLSDAIQGYPRRVDAIRGGSTFIQAVTKLSVTIQAYLRHVDVIRRKLGLSAARQGYPSQRKVCLPQSSLVCRKVALRCGKSAFLAAGGATDRRAGP